ncbi:MAG: hypothetical protein H7343_16890 [Undibacterium sp.]|nr:hypothetical protein [Opitutaceae bacterium]
MQIVRDLPASPAEPDGHGGWQASSGSTVQTHHDIDEVFVPRLRTRIIMLLGQNALVYRDRLAPAVRARDDFIYATYEKLWRAHGVACVTVDSGFTATDYRDRTHLSATGGEKLARLVAAEIRRFPAP